MSYYRTINGQRYDAALLDRAEALIQGPGDGRIAHVDAQRLLAEAQDGQGITTIEQQTLRYLMTAYNWTDKAKNFMEEQLEHHTGQQRMPNGGAEAQETRLVYERLREAYWKNKFEQYQGGTATQDQWAGYAVGREGGILPYNVLDALWYYDQTVEQADWGQVTLYRFPLDEDGYFYAVETRTDGDDGWVELYTTTGQLWGAARTYIELVYWGEQAAIRRYVETGQFPEVASHRYERTLWSRQQ